MMKSIPRVIGPPSGRVILILVASGPFGCLAIPFLQPNGPLFFCTTLLFIALVVFVSRLCMQPRVNVSLSSSVILLLAALVTFASLGYLQPPDCPRGFTHNRCKPGEQTAGFPFPILHDGRSGGSPLSSIGRMDYSMEDIETFNFLAFYADVLFYGLVLWLLAGVVRLASRLIRR